MTDRARFLATMNYEPRDRCPMFDFGFWPETIPTWHDQGMPEDVTYHGYNGTQTDAWFGMDSYSGGAGVNVGLVPGFPVEVLEDRGDHEVVQQVDGVRVLRKKTMGSIPMHLGHLLTDRESWNKHYKPRLDPTTPGRLPGDEDPIWAHLRDDTRPDMAVVWGGSLYGWLRDWMGVENLSMVVYDEPEWFGEMVETLADLTVSVFERMFAKGVKIDACSMWEDMCYSGGPLLSPTHFKEYLVPQYRRITDVLHRNGVKLTWIDCDGKIDALIPLWLEGGVNIMFPIEVGTWSGDPVAMRREYGKDLLLMGGVGKITLKGDPQGIRDEVARLAPLVEEGGYIPMPDHRVPPDVPYAKYLVYLEEARRVWGRGTNLKPCPALEAVRA